MTTLWLTMLLTHWPPQPQLDPLSTLKRKSLSSVMDGLQRRRRRYNQVFGTPIRPYSRSRTTATRNISYVTTPLCYICCIMARYEDDTFAILKRTEVNTFFSYISQVSPEIKFTREEENSGSITFLNVYVSTGPCGTIDT